MSALVYLLTILIANVVTASYHPLALGPFLIPMGTFFIGATFIIRDIVQNQYGRKNAYLTIVLALILSAVVSKWLGDTLAITIASAISFALAETTDTEMYTRFNLPILKRVFTSGTVSSLLDSTVFVIIGLSPIGAGFVPWAFIPYAILGQFLGKTLMQALGTLAYSALCKKQVMCSHCPYTSSCTVNKKESAEFISIS